MVITKQFSNSFRSALSNARRDAWPLKKEDKAFGFLRRIQKKVCSKKCWLKENETAYIERLSKRINTIRKYPDRYEWRRLRVTEFDIEQVKAMQFEIKKRMLEQRLMSNNRIILRKKKDVPSDGN